MAGRDKPKLPSLTLILVTALGLSSRAQTLLAESEFQFVGQLFRPTQAQREMLKIRGTPADLREISRKLRHFYRSYLAVKELLEHADRIEAASEVPASSHSQSDLARNQGSGVPEGEAAVSEAVTNVPLTELRLSRGIRATLERAGIHSVAQLMQMTDKELAQIGFIGEWRVAGIRSAVNEFLAQSRSSQRKEAVEKPLLDEPWSTSTEAVLDINDTPLAELIDRWLRRYLPLRERTFVEQQLGLYGLPKTVSELSAQYDASEDWVRLLRENALNVLRDQQEDISPLLQLIEARLEERADVLAAEQIAGLLNEQSVELGVMRSPGLLALLAELNDEWAFATADGGALVIADSSNEWPETEADKPEPIESVTAEKAASALTDETTPSEAVSTESEDDVGDGSYISPTPLLPTTHGADVADETDHSVARRPRRRKVRETGPLWLPRAEPHHELILDSHSPLYLIEMELRQRLHRVDFIGELAIEKEQFESWCQLVREEAVRAGRIRPKLIPPALFVTLMVLATRYSEERHRSFWEPYAQMVWGLDEASPYFQKQCRDYFGEAIGFLVGAYDLTFPQRTSGDLVRPVYRHAIIPAYLEPDFVDWLKRRWEEVLEIPPDHLVAHLQQESSLRYLPPTLYRFINEPDTAVAAADLIRNMAFAASLYNEGKSLAFIGELLADNPIERSLWEEFAVVFASQEEQTRRRPRARLEWVWSVETTELMLRLRNVVLHTDATPDLAVWVASDTPVEDLPFADVYARLDPWQLEEEEWLVDELLFAPDGPLDGKIVLLGGDDSILWQQALPRLPAGPIQFFRLSQQGAYALPVDDSSVQPGRYVVACGESVTINEEKAEALLSQQSLTLPYLIKDRFVTAGFYTISPPLEIKHEQRKVMELATSSLGLGMEPPHIVGEMPVPGLSPRVPPAFRDRNIWLVIPSATNHFLDRTSLWLRSQRGSFQRYLLSELEVEVDEVGAFWVPLHTLLADSGGYYTVELRQGLRALLAAPLELLHVPGFEVVPPPKQPEDAPVYTPVHRPSVRVKGVTPEQIGNPTQVEAISAEDGWMLITWNDVRGDCRLLLRINEQSLPLAWPVQRFSAWIEPEPYDGVFAPGDLDKAVFRAAGSRAVVDFFSVSIAGDEYKQQIKLDAQGQFSALLRRHWLRDIIDHQPGGRVQIDASVFGHSWPLLILQRYLELPEAEIAYDAEEASLLLDTGLQDNVGGAYTFFASPVDGAATTEYPLANVERLEPLHIIPCHLPPGRYRFEVRDDENILTPPMLTFQTRKADENPTASIVSPLKTVDVTIRAQPHSELAELIAQEGDSELTADRLWRLATIPGPSLAAHDREHLEKVWKPLANLQDAHDGTRWKQQFGLLPAWVITSRPLRFTFNQRAAVIYPEVALNRGLRGIGYTNLSFIHGLSRVYATWEPARSEQQVVRVRLAVPPSRLSENYRYVDDLDLVAVYQCSTCGFFLSESQKRAGKHAHAGEKELTFIEVHNWTNDSPFLAKVTPCSPDAILRFVEGPETVIDRSIISRGLSSRRSYSYTFHEISNPTTRSAHRSVCSAWLGRYWDDSGARWHLTRLLSAASWQRAAGNLERTLASGSNTMPAACTAAARLVKVFGPRKDRSVYNLDRDLLLLALLARHAAAEPTGAATVRRQIGADEALLRDVLFDAQTYAPELLQWALAWVELFFAHSLT